MVNHFNGTQQTIATPVKFFVEMHSFMTRIDYFFLCIFFAYKNFRLYPQLKDIENE